MSSLVKNGNYKKAVTVCDMAFKIEFLIFGFLTVNAYACGRPIMSVFVFLSTALAGIDLLARALSFKSYIKNIFLWILGLFLVSYSVSMVVNRDLGFMTPLKTLVWMGMQYVLLFAFDETKDKKAHIKEFNIFSYVFVSWTFVSSFISVIQAFIGYGVTTKVEFSDYHVYINSGLVWGRLWGVYQDPNYGSVIATVALLLSVYYFSKNKNVLFRAFHALNIVVELLYIAFSDSRTGLVSLTFSAAALTFLTLFKREPKEGKKVAAVRAVTVLLTLVVAFSAVVVPMALTKGFNRIQQSINTSDPGSEPDAELIIGREQDIESDISNRRFDLWKSGYEIFKTAPIFGVCHDNVKQYAEKNCPDTYLVNNDYHKFNNFHNSFVNVLVGQGAVGFIIACGFTAFAALYVLIKFFKNKENSPLLALLISIVIAVGCSMMFLTEVFYTNMATTVIFWYALGLSICLLKTRDDEHV